MILYIYSETVTWLNLNVSTYLYMFLTIPVRNDLLMALKKLKVLGNGFSVIPIGRSHMVQSVPGELNMDHTQIIQQAEVDRLCANFIQLNLSSLNLPLSSSPTTSLELLLQLSSCSG